MSYRIYSLPQEEPLSSLYACEILGDQVPVRFCRVSAAPINRRWPGHQRQIDQSEEAAFISFEMDAPVTLRITPNRMFHDVIVRPLSKKVTSKVEDGAILLTLPSPGGYSLELDGYHNNLHIFADPPKDYGVAVTDDVLRYGPGFHDAGIVKMKSNQTIYLDEGAVVYGCFHAENCENIKILGRGVIDNSRNTETILFEMEELGDGQFDVKNSKRENTIQLINCKNIRLYGFTIRDSLVYNVGLWGCDDIEIENIKIVGCWRYNSDGIDFHNCRRGHVTGCFVRSFDDTICFKGHMGYQQVCEDILVENCVVWCDWGRCLEIGVECCADHMRNLVFRDVDIIRSLVTCMDIGNVDYGHVHDVVYENIRVEYDSLYQSPHLQSSDDEIIPFDETSRFLPRLMNCLIFEHPEYSEGRAERGHISGVKFQNIQVAAGSMPPSFFGGCGKDNKVRDVKINGLFVNGERITNTESANIEMNEYVENICFCPC